jgi:hypothetical protein
MATLAISNAAEFGCGEFYTAVNVIYGDNYTTK